MKVNRSKVNHVMKPGPKSCFNTLTGQRPTSELHWIFTKKIHNCEVYFHLPAKH